MHPNLQALLPEAKSSRVLAAAVGLGVVIGVVVSVFEWVTVALVFERLEHYPLWVQATAPVFGLAITVLVLRTLGRNASPATSDEYVYAYHSRTPSLPLRTLPARLLGGVATIGMGGALGLEGPSIYAGSTLGLQVYHRLDRWLGRDGAKLLLTAGAAAGVAAVFQAPATGVVFALEAPYRDDLAHRALLPALMASAASYLTFITMPFANPAPLLGQEWPTGIGAADLIAAVAIGVGAGVGGRLFAALTRRAKRFSNSTPWPVLVLVGGGLLGVLAVAADQIFEEPLTLGPGVGAARWALDDHAVYLVALLFVMRALATLITVGAGGVGGLFIPLAVQGVLLGRLVGVILEGLDFAPEDVGMLPLLGLAAFLAAGYRTPIAAVMFVAESTGNSGNAVVPALVAAAVSQLVAGDESVTAGQRVERLGHLEERFTMPVAAALTTDVMTVPPDATVSEFVWIHALGRRQTVVPVVEGNNYVGLCTVENCARVDRAEWENTEIEQVVDRDMPQATPEWTLRDAVAAMDDAGTDLLAVTDGDGQFVGVVLAAEIVKLGEILDETGG